MRSQVLSILPLLPLTLGGRQATAHPVGGSDVYALPATLDGSGESRAGVSEAVSLPPRVSDDWRATVEEEICQSEHHATWQERTCLDDLPAAYQAPIVLDLALPGGLTPHLTAEGLGLPDPTPDEVVIAVHEYRIYLPLVLENQS